MCLFSCITSIFRELGRPRQYVREQAVGVRFVFRDTSSKGLVADLDRLIALEEFIGKHLRLNECFSWGERIKRPKRSLSMCMMWFVLPQLLSFAALPTGATEDRMEERQNTALPGSRQ